jgi:ribokinase
MGSDGALLAVKSDQFMERYRAVNIRPVVNTIGAGDALYSAFLHFYIKGERPHIALRKAIIFAGYKIGERSAASGFLTESELNDLFVRML